MRPIPRWHRCLTLSLIFLLATQFVCAFTDPEPNPFLETETNQVYDGIVVIRDETSLKVRTDAGAEFSSALSEIAKYREGGGPAESEEFSANDRVRFAVNSTQKLFAVQDAELLLCDQNFVGRVESLTSEAFELTTLNEKNYRVHVGALTLFRDETTKQLLLNTKLEEAQPIRVHGVMNTNTHEIFTATFGAYISPLTETTFQIAQDDYANAHPFTDVAENTPHREAIAFIKTRKIVTGYADGTFRPEQTINRAEFTKILINAKFGNTLEATDTMENCFSDFAREAWFAKYVCLAKTEKIIGGYPDGTFRAEQNINLAEAVKIVLTTFGVETIPATTNEAWYAPYLAKALELEILPDGITEPAHPMTRGEMAEIIWRAKQLK